MKREDNETESATGRENEWGFVSANTIILLGTQLTLSPLRKGLREERREREGHRVPPTTTTTRHYTNPIYILIALV